MSTNVLGRRGRLGSSLADFCAARITEPLRLADTAFAATGGRTARPAELQIDPATDLRPPMRHGGRNNRWASGGGGPVSTAADYHRFCQMLLSGGELDGLRLLAPAYRPPLPDICCTGSFIEPSPARSPSLLRRREGR